MLEESAGQVPANQEELLLTEWQAEGLDTTDTGLLAGLFESAGATALMVGNLETAQWAFAQAASLMPDSASALTGLGFTLTEQARYGEALTALAAAGQLDPSPCAVQTNIGGVFSRNRQIDDALLHYQQAEAACPHLAQHSLHVGALLLRRGDDQGAKAAFDRAVQKNPADMQAAMMSLAMSPPTSDLDIDQFEPLHEQWLVEAYGGAGAVDEDGKPYWEAEHWKDLDIKDKVRSAINLVQYFEQKKLDAEVAAIQGEMDQTLEQLLESLVPANNCSDVERASRFFTVFEEILATKGTAKVRAQKLAVAAGRRVAVKQANLGLIILQAGVTDAQQAMAQARNASDARRIFENTVAEYEAIVDSLNRALKDPHPLAADLNVPALSFELGSLFLGNLLSVMANECGGDLEEPKPFEVKADPQEFAIAVSNGLVTFEIKPLTGEIKIQVGQGAIVAGTWSPKNGFGFQLGVGVDLVVAGTARVTAVEWVKFGSDGSVALETELGGSFGKIAGGNWSSTASVRMTPATHEPIGVFN